MQGRISVLPFHLWSMRKSRGAGLQPAEHTEESGYKPAPHRNQAFDSPVGSQSLRGNSVHDRFETPPVFVLIQAEPALLLRSVSRSGSFFRHKLTFCRRPLVEYSSRKRIRLVENPSLVCVNTESLLNSSVSKILRRCGICCSDRCWCISHPVMCIFRSGFGKGVLPARFSVSTCFSI
jgi:hypothetical protein